MIEKKLILVIAGGIGNQLFMYAAAKRIAKMNGAKLLLDIDSRFEKDSYQQIYQLDKFNISTAVVPPELQYYKKWVGFQRYAYTKINKLLPFNKRWLVLEEAGKDKMSFFDPRVLDLKLSHKITYCGECFQCENYFTDIREELLEEFTVSPPFNNTTVDIASEISSLATPVAVHARQLRGSPQKDIEKQKDLAQKSFSYYDQAIKYMANKVKKPHFFCFGDDPEWLEKNWSYEHPATFVSHNNSLDEATQDFYLMGLCKHFIVGNSTFSWWPAWLSQAEDKIVIAPVNKEPNIWSGNKDIIPSSWVII